ncbi:two-component regulator propeller domain-containing protein [Pedobacter sp. AW31-3R]|uniref:sensor histidine kinase n=1 Tax=Pedobacter sp. AW31-3R TaxID=3445781 RepID=UPI003FA0DB28
MVNTQIIFRRKLFLLFAAFLFSGSLVFAQTTFIRHFTTRDGLPSNNCYYTLQDSNGYIWIASDAGVSRYDGKMFENFSIDDGLPDNQIIQLNEDKAGRIWFSALNGQLSYFYNGKIYNEHNDQLLKMLKFSGVIVSFFEDSRGNIWFGTNKNILAKWDGKSLKKYSSASNSHQYINTFIYEDKANQIWAYSAHCLRVYDGENFEIVNHRISPISYKTALNLPDHTMSFLDKNGLNFKNGYIQKLTLKVDPALLNDNPGYYYAEGTKELWMSTNTGVYHLQEGKKTQHYLYGITTNQVIRDDRNNMWFTTSNGIYMLPKKENRIYIADAGHGLSNNHVKSITKDSQGNLWLGLDGGMLNSLKHPGGAVHKISLPDQTKFRTIKQLSYHPAYKALIFASDNGLGILKNYGEKNQHVSYLQETNNLGFVLKGFSLSPNNNLALSLSSGVVILNNPFRSLSFTSFDYEEGINYFSGRSYHVYYGQSGNLWFSNINGLSELRGNRLNKDYQQHNLLTKRINDIIQSGNGTTILATDGYGLLFYKNNTLLKQLTLKEGLSNNICKRLFVRDNEVWVITNSGINKVNASTYKIESFEYTSTVLTNDVNDLYIDRDTAWFATNQGLVYFPVSSARGIKKAPKVLISSIICNKTVMDPHISNFSLGPSDNTIMFYYSALDFENKNILYRYRLKAENNWTETRNRRLELSSLEPGAYTFELCAKTINSDWSKPVSVDFTLREHFWQSTYFIILLLLMVSFSCYKIAVIVTRQQKNKEQQQLLFKNKILMLEQRALQAMMNPHFVFNVMNSIQHYINTKDTSSANKILTGFARLIRKNLDICTRSFITLEEEIEYLTLYLNLEKKRFGEKLNFSIQIDHGIDLDETLLPSMLLQPYVENAIWHGLMPQEESGHIDILVSRTENHSLLIKIIDNGVGIDNSMRVKSDGHTSKGMSLTQERINLINQIEAHPIQIDITQNGKSGTTISILVPFK